MIPTFAAALIAGAGDVAAAPGYSEQMAEAAGVSALLLVVLALLLCIAIGIFALTLRHRAKNPPPEAVLLEEVSREQDAEEALAGGAPESHKPKERKPWEKPDDWWKPGD